jgi:DNA repair exonuclease SbcCD ATPase subunit
MLGNVRLENFGPHKLFEHEFLPGINLVLGPNGIGKSHILYGIAWIVFGHKALPDEYTQSDIIHDGEKFTSGETTFDLLGQPHTFSRSYDGKNIQASVYRGDEEVATGARGVEEWLAGYGITWDAASVLFSRQRELDAFIYETPAERKRIFESLLRVEVVNDARKIARARQSENTVECNGILAETTLEALKKSRDVADARRLECIKSAEILVRYLETATTERAEALEVLTTASSETRAVALQGYLRSKRDKIFRFNQRLETLNPAILSAPILTNDKVARSKLKIADIENAVEQAHQDINTELGDNTELKERRGLLLGKLEALDTTLARLKDGDCPTCGTVITDPEKHISAVHGVLRADVEAERDEATIELATSDKKIADLQASIDRADAERLQMSTELSAFEYAVSLVPEAEQIKSDLADAEKDAEAYEEEIRNLAGPSPEQRDAFEAADKAAQKAAENDRFAKAAVTEIDHEVVARRNAVNEYEIAQREAAEGEENRKLWAAVSKALDEFRNQVLQSALNWVSLRATQIVRTIGTLPGGGPTVQLSLDKDLQFWFTSEGRDVPVYRFSGGQKAIFAICLRMALSEYFSDRLGLKGFLLLDAVLDSLTKDNQDATAAALQAAGPQQAILFSHFDVEGLEAHRVNL